MGKVTYENHPGQSIFISSLFNWVVAIAYWFKYRMVIRLEGEVPAEGPVLVLAKHWRYADIPLGKLALMRKGKRHLWCVMKDTLARGPFAGLLLRVGGIPLNRTNPEKSKRDLLLARQVLTDGNMICLFPEQTRVPGKMGRGKLPGFRFIMGKPKAPVGVICVGFNYKPRRFRRTTVEIGIGGLAYFSRNDDPEAFFQQQMNELARLSGLAPREIEKKEKGKRKPAIQETPG